MKDLVLFFIANISLLFVGCQGPLNTIQNTNTDNVVLPPSVQSVSNSGMRIVNVAFDKAIDQTSAETVTNYNIKNNKTSTVSVQSAKLLTDTKTVQLFLSAGMYNDSVVDSIDVKNVQGVAQTTTMTAIIKEFTMSDSSVPTVVSVEALGSKAIRISFSEAIQGVAGSVFRFDDMNSSITSVDYPDAGDYTKAVVNFSISASVGAHTLTVGINNTLTDYNVTADGTVNSNTMQPAGYVVTVSADTSIPTLSSVEVLSQNKARYTFSEAVQTPSENAFFWSTSSTETSGTFATLVTKVTDMVYDISWSSAISAGTTYFYVGTTTNKVVDYSGNTISPLPSSKVAVVK